MEYQRICKKCKNILNSSDEFCPHCGRRFQRKPVNYKAISIVLASILLLILAFVVFACINVEQCMSVLHKIAPSPSPTVSTVHTTKAVYVTPKQTTTQKPTPNPTKNMLISEDPSDYGLSKKSYSYDSFIEMYNKTVSAWQNNNSAEAINLKAKLDNSITKNRYQKWTSIRHQLNKNVALSVNLVGYHPYVADITLICTWSNQKTHDAVFLSAFALIDMVSNNDQGLYKSLSKIFQGDSMKKVSKSINSSTIIIEPYADEIRIRISYAE